MIVSFWFITNKFDHINPWYFILGQINLFPLKTPKPLSVQHFSWSIFIDFFLKFRILIYKFEVEKNKIA